MKKVLILVCFLIVLSGIGIASAETVTGTLSTSGLNLTDYTMPYEATGGATVASITNLFIKDIQYATGISYLIRYDITAKPTFTAGSPTGNTTPVVFKIGATQIGTGTFGYQRVYNGAGVEQLGFQYLVFNSDWDPTAYTGDQTVTIEGIPINGITYTISAFNDDVLPYSGAMKFGTSANGWFGNYSVQRSLTFSNEYSATKPSGIGITGYVTKDSGGSIYPSKAWVFDGTSGITLANEATLTSTQWNFSVSAATIKIGVQDSTGVFYNSSILFAPTPTVTPTATMTPVPTVAPGYVRSNVWVMDHLGNAVHGVDIAMYDVEGTTWSNSTSDADARHYIDTLPYHTLNLYADFTAFPGEFLPASLLGVETGYYGTGYYLVMYPTAAPAGEGNTNLYVTVMDEDTGDLIRAASLTVTYGTATQGGTTGTTGTDIFVVPNQTDIRIAASKFGYTSATQYLNSGTGTVVNTQIELSKLLVTTVPTSTIPPGGVTPAVTADPNDPAITGSTNAKGQEMLNWLAMNGMDLVQLCFLVTMLALLGVKLGK